MFISTADYGAAMDRGHPKTTEKKKKIPVFPQISKLFMHGDKKTEFMENYVEELQQKTNTFFLAPKQNRPNYFFLVCERGNKQEKAWARHVKQGPIPVKPMCLLNL